MNKLEVAQTKHAGSIKALIGSLIGLAIFFIPFSTAEEGTKIPLVMMIDYVKDVLAGSLDYLTLGVIVLLCFTWLASRFTSNEAIRNYHRKDGVMTGITFLLAAFLPSC